jgi:replicative DNA helicase
MGTPRLIDLRDCGSIEEDADIVGLLFRLEYYQTGQEIEQAITGEAELIIAKQRNGPNRRGSIDLSQRVRTISIENSGS